MKTLLLAIAPLLFCALDAYPEESGLNAQQWQSITPAGPAADDLPDNESYETIVQSDAGNGPVTEEPADESAAEEEFLQHQILPEVREADLPGAVSVTNKFLEKFRPGIGPLIIGHRGFGQKTSPEPENTLAALKKGFSMGAAAIELDVQFSKDGDLMITHNSDIDAVTMSHGCVADYSRDQLQSMILVDGDKRPSPERLAAFDDAVRLLQGQTTGLAHSADGGIVAVVHVKVFDGFHGDWPGVRRLLHPCPKTDYASIARKTLGFVDRAGIVDKVLFVSFDHRVLDTIRSINPRTKVGLLSVRRSLAIDAAAARKYDAVVLRYNKVQRKDLLRARSRGLTVYVWTPTDKQSIARFTSETGGAGLVDGIITNSIPNALAVAR